MSSPTSTTSNTQKSSSEQHRPYIFINSNDPVNPNKIISSTDDDKNGGNESSLAQPFFKLPFPPKFSLEDLLVTTKKDESTRSKMPNAFIIYRRAFVKTAREEGYRLPMTMVSTMASQSWKLESAVVKTEYKRVAKLAKVQYELSVKHEDDKNSSSKAKSKSVKKQSRAASSSPYKASVPQKENKNSFPSSPQLDDNNKDSLSSSPQLDDNNNPPFDPFSSLTPSPSLIHSPISPHSPITPLTPYSSLPEHQQESMSSIFSTASAQFFDSNSIKACSKIDDFAAPFIYEFEEFLNEHDDDNSNSNTDSDEFSLFFEVL
ncbi:7997_t:CDS:2 [Ambispora gerdemannii]|uniref:7997_t:CDS:1 n=1 Tax=Ambispora gerdemannii TaxID=144530 RepID=A0A9N9FS92_9GLOM|nr:7997_t:CDS:2 [Ambispora gerdemannii]